MRPVSRFIQDHNPFASLAREQVGAWVLINTAALAAMAFSKRPAVFYGAIGSMLGSSAAVCYQAWRKDESCTSIFWEALLGAGIAGCAFLSKGVHYPERELSEKFFRQLSENVGPDGLRLH